ncbi:MAG: PDZ domain-containing protein, partial [Rubripirellula sp.]
MPRQIGSICLALIAICLLSEMDMQSSSAQLFRRLQNRRQNRVTPQPQPKPSAQRVSPSSQSQKAPTPAAPKPAASPNPTSSSANSNVGRTVDRSRGGLKDLLSKFGPSILIRPGQRGQGPKAESSTIRQVSAEEPIKPSPPSKKPSTDSGAAGTEPGKAGIGKTGTADAAAKTADAAAKIEAANTEAAEERTAEKRTAEKPPIDGVATGDRPMNASAKVRPSLGIEVLESQSGVPGVSVTGFRADSKAEIAGLRKGDVIVAIDNKPTPSIAAVAAILSERKVGQRVQARVLRGQQIQVVSIPLLGPQAPASPLSIDARDNAPVDNPFAETLPRSKEAPALEPAPQSDRAPVALGVSVRPLEGARGVSVSEVRPGTPAFAAGLQPGDRIVSV